MLLFVANHKLVCCRVVENNQFDCNIWSNPKLPVQYVQPSSGIAVDKQWKPTCTSTMSTLRMPPGLALPASSQLQRPVLHLQMSRQPGSVQPSVPSNEAGWLKRAELTEDLLNSDRCHAMVANGNPQNIGAGRDNVISNEQYQQQQQALLMAQVQATLHALQSCPQQPVSTDEHSQHAAVVGQLPAISQRPVEQTRFSIACGKPDEPQVVTGAQQSIFVNGKNVRILPDTATPSAPTNSASAHLQLQQSSEVVQQGQMLDLSKCMISTTPGVETGVTVHPYPMPQQAFMQSLCNEPMNNQLGPPASRRLLSECFQDSGRPFVRSSAAAVPLNITTDKMQSFEQNQLFVHGQPNLRCTQSAWNANSPRQSQYSQYCVPSNVSAEQYNMVGRLTPVMVGPAGDIFCNSIPSQVGSVPSPIMVGSKFPR